MTFKNTKLRFLRAVNDDKYRRDFCNISKKVTKLTFLRAVNDVLKATKLRFFRALDDVKKLSIFMRGK